MIDAGFDVLAQAALDLGADAEAITVCLDDGERIYTLRVETDSVWSECPVTCEFLEDSAVDPAPLVARDVVERSQLLATTS